MFSLVELQTRFLEGVLERDMAAAQCVVRSKAPQSAARMAIYVNNAFANIEASLKIGFPVFLRLVGDDYFHQCAHQYHQAHRSGSGDLHHVGRAFPTFIADLHDAGEYRYLADVALLEWALQESRVAADHASLDFARLRMLSAVDYEDLVFRLHPSVRLVASPFPIYAIWQDNAQDSTNQVSIDLGAGSAHVLVARMPGACECVPISAAEYRFLEGLKAERPLAEVVGAVGNDDPSFSAADALRKFVLCSVIVDFQ